MTIIDDELKAELAKRISTIPEGDTESNGESINTIYRGFIEESSKLVFDAVLSKRKLAYRINKRDEKKITSKIEKKWREAFQYFDLMISGLYEMGEEYFTQYKSQAIQEQNYIFEALNRSFIRCIQISEEISVLLKHGFPDGAHGRWRTLHEISTIMAFLKKYDNSELAIKYLEHQNIETYKFMLQYDKYSDKLNYPPLTAQEKEEGTEIYTQLIAKYGSEYKTDFGWAATTLNKNRPTFFDIEKDVGFDIYRPDYKLACYNTHAGAKGLYFKLYNPPAVEDFIFPGSSNDGFADPAHGAAISLYHATNSFFNIYESIDWQIIINIFYLFSEKVGESFLAIQNSA